MKNPFRGGKTFSLDLSVGVVAFPIHGGSINELLRRADQAMYRVKEEGDGVSSYLREAVALTFC